MSEGYVFASLAAMMAGWGAILLINGVTNDE